MFSTLFVIVKRELDKMIKKLFCILFVCSLFYAHSQDTIDVEWQSVLGGNVVAPPKRTSYGFILLSEGRILNAVTENGTILWRRNIRGMPSSFYTVTDENFIYLTTNNATFLSKYNPDGAILWETLLEGTAISDPLSGRDGRVFVAEENAISAYGTMGIRKWRTEVPQGEGLPLVEMNDGSLLYILQAKKGAGSMALRISPYGDILEEIEFIDTVTTLKSYEDGVILGFENGTIGSCAVIDGKTKTTASVFYLQEGVTPKSITVGNEGFCVLFTNNTISEYALDKQTLLWSTSISQNLNYDDVSVSFIGDSYVLANASYVSSYSSGSKGGVLTWEKYIRESEGSYFPIVTRSAYVIVARPNWVIAGYKLFEQEMILENVPSAATDFKTYSQFKSTARHLHNLNTMLEQLKTGNYGVKELEYKRTIDNALFEYNNEYSSFVTNIHFGEKSQIYMLSSLFQSSDYTHIVPLILQNEIDPYYIQLAFEVAANIAYDPKESMLQAIEEYYSTHTTLLNENQLLSLCDAVYAICHYMGRPALTKRGKQILTSMLQTSKSVAVQKKVSETLYSFIELEN